MLEQVRQHKNICSSLFIMKEADSTAAIKYSINFSQHTVNSLFVIILILHLTQKKPETVSRPPEYDSDDAFEQLADITIGAEDSDTNVTIPQPIQKTFETKKRMSTEKDIQQPRTGKII